jgi:hypothetical protein
MDENQLSKFLFVPEDELKSYSDSFESRARDRFIAYVKEMFELGSTDEYGTMFHADRIVINKRNRRLLDYIEVTALIDRVEVISLNQEVTERLIHIIKVEKGFETVHHDEVNSRVTIPLPPLTFNQQLELNDAAIAKLGQLERTFFAVKSQTGQQIKKGIENEYITQIDSAKVSKEIDQVIEHYLYNARLFAIAKREMIMGSFKPKTDLEVELYPHIKPATDFLTAAAAAQAKPPEEESEEDMTMVE